MNTCTRCGGKFLTRTSGIQNGVKTCTSAFQCDQNIKDQAERAAYEAAQAHDLAVARHMNNQYGR